MVNLPTVRLFLLVSAGRRPLAAASRCMIGIVEDSIDAFNGFVATLGTVASQEND
jgi:hypothetical protein